MKKTATILTLLLFSTIGYTQDKIAPLAIGAQAPDFNLPGTDGKNYTLKDFSKYDYLVILFTCNHCPTAQAYEDKFIKAVNDYRPKGVGFLAISPNDPSAITLSELGYTDLSDDLDDMKERVEFKGYNFPYIYDGETQGISKAYGPAATPHIFIFDKGRKLKYSGRIDDTEDPYVKPGSEDMINALDALLAGKEAPIATTKTFGCSIKWATKSKYAVELMEKWAQEPVALDDSDLDGIKSLMKNDTDKFRVINFWATWCGPCIIEMPYLVEMNRMYRRRDFELVTVTTDKVNKKEKALEILKENEVSSQNYIFTGKDIYELIEVVDPNWQGSLPYTAVIAPGGKIVYNVEGAFEELELKRAIIKQIGRYYANDGD